MPQIRVMQLAQTLRPGGLERVVVDLVNHASDEFHLLVCCLDEPGPWADQINPQRGEVFALGRKPGLDLRLVPKLAKLVRSRGIEVVHTHNAAAHLYGSVGGKLGGAAILHTEHHPKKNGEAVRINRVNRFAARFTDFSVAVSPQLAEIAVQYEGVRREKLGVVPNGICVELYSQPVDRTALRRELGIPAAARLIGTVGRLVPQKNHALLIRAFKGLSAAHADTFLAVAGDGTLRQDLVKLVESLDLSQRVFFLGHRGDIPQLLGSFDLFALSSDNEGHPVALLEAMAAACPAVVTTVPGNVDLIENGVNGLLVPPDDSDALQRALHGLLLDAGCARRLGHAAQAKVREQFSLQHMVRQYEQLWRRLAKHACGNRHKS